MENTSLLIYKLYNHTFIQIITDVYAYKLQICKYLYIYFHLEILSYCLLIFFLILNIFHGLCLINVFFNFFNFQCLPDLFNGIRIVVPESIFKEKFMRYFIAYPFSNITNILLNCNNNRLKLIIVLKNNCLLVTRLINSKLRVYHTLFLVQCSCAMTYVYSVHQVQFCLFISCVLYKILSFLT